MDAPTLSADLLRNLTLLLPALGVAVAAYVRHRHGVRHHPDRGVCEGRAPAAALASLTAFLGVVAVDQLARAQGWWVFADSPTSLGGVPMEVLLGWALAWGALPVLAGGHPLAWLIGFGWIDVLAMPRLTPMVELRDGWLVGEVLLLAFAALPALALGHLSVRALAVPVGERPYEVAARTTLQAATFVGLICWYVPHLTLAAEGISWYDVVDHSYPVRSLLLAAAVVLGTPAIAAAVELTLAGGTPWPWDPPRRLATTGPYAYVANPMQLSMVALLVLLAAAAGSIGVLVAAGVAFAFSAFIADPHEKATMGERWPGYAAYRAEVRPWLPRWRPYVPEPATLWVSATCELCTATGDAIDRLDPTGMERRAAECAPEALNRMRWECGEVSASGVAAFARAVEHGSLPTAWLGWWMRLPGVCWLLQRVADAVGLGPREVPRWAAGTADATDAGDTTGAPRTVGDASPTPDRGDR